MAHKSSITFLSSLLLIFFLCGPTYSRLITHRPPSVLISDGVHDDLRSQNMLRVDPNLESDTCDDTYGFMPCTTTIIGNLFLLIVYGYLMYLGAKYLSSGSELLVQILGPGIIGGLFLPILGAFPDAMLILVSGLSGTTATAQSQVSVGMGLLAGSTVMLLTVIWGTCVIVGKCDLENSSAVDGKDTKRFSLTGSAVSTDIWTSYAAMIMAVSAIPFIVVQLLQLLDSTSARHLAVLIGLIISLSLLISYCLYQVIQPWIQIRRLNYAKRKRIIAGILKYLKKRTLGKLSDGKGNPNKVVLEKLFKTLDLDKDGFLSTSEMTALIVGIRFEDIDFDQDATVDEIVKGFDTSRDGKIDFDEFIAEIKKWLGEARRTKAASHLDGADTNKYISFFLKETKRTHEVAEDVKNPKWTSFKAVLLLLLGTVIAAVFSDPLVDAVDNFSSATSIPSFFISFIALPIATNSSESVSAIIFASRKNQTSSSLTFSELYGAATMNNVLCLSVFLAIVYVRDLSWEFSAEVLIIVIVCFLMSAFASFRTTFPLWTSLVAFLLYPLSLALVYVLDYICGWE